MTTYADDNVENAPPWMQSELARRLKFVLGLVKDAFVEATKQAVKARFPSRAPVDALPSIAASRQIDRGWGFDETSFRAQLKRPFSLARGQGTTKGIQEAVQRAGYPNAKVLENWQVSVQPSDPTLTIAKAWARIWVLLYPPFPFGDVVIPTWDDAAVWNDSSVWTEGVDGQEIARLQRIVRRLKPKHITAKLVFVIGTGAEVWGDPPSALWGDDGPGVWGGQTLEVTV